eukprot:4335326-Prymnesium_polylepis.1
MSSMRSASSSTTILMLLHPTQLDAPPPRTSKTSLIRPGVPMMSSQLRRKALTCAFLAVPPYTATDLHPTQAPYLVASACIWMASSRVGAMMMPRGEPLAAGRSATQRASTGSRNPSVLPEPVFAIARTSRPDTAMGHVAACTGDGVVNGCDVSSLSSAGGKGASARLRHGGGALPS